MNTELLKEAVGYAGWKIRDADPDYDPPDSFWAGDMFYAPNIGWYSFRKVPKGVIAALASQLIEQVLAAGFDFSQEDQGSHFEAPGTWIVIHDPIKSERRRFELDGRDGRNENSITACVEFMRGRG